MSELLRETTPERKTASAPKASINAADAVRLVVNTAVAMKENEPVISVRSVTESKRGPGILIWIPGYIESAGTIIIAGRVDHADLPERVDDRPTVGAVGSGQGVEHGGR
jgi:hypothetical protein